MYQNILVPISFDDDRNGAAALRVAQELRQPGGQMTLLHVMEEAPAYAISFLPTDYHDAAKGAIEAELGKLSTGLDPVEAQVIDGHAGRSILSFAEEIGADCIVIASHRPGMRELLLGTTADQVTRHAGCTVHVVR